MTVEVGTIRTASLAQENLLRTNNEPFTVITNLLLLLQNQMRIYDRMKWAQHPERTVSRVVLCI